MPTPEVPSRPDEPLGDDASDDAGDGAARRAPALDPFAVYARGEDALRRALCELSADELRAVVRAAGIDPDTSATGDVVEGVVADVRRRLTGA